MSIYEFDEEREMELIRQDEREIGREEGREQGEQAGLERGRAEGRQQAVISLCKDFGCSYEDAVRKLMEKCSLTEEEAVARMDKYWTGECETVHA